MERDYGRAPSEPGYSAEPEPLSGVSALSGEYPSRIELGLPWPWRFHKIAVCGDTCFFWSYSSRTLAFGFEALTDGFVFFVGVFCVGWASISAAMRRDSDRNPQGGDSAQTEAPFMSGAVPSQTADAQHPLARMVELDEEIEADHPGWMTGDAPTGDDNV